MAGRLAMAILVGVCLASIASIARTFSALDVPGPRLDPYEDPVEVGPRVTAQPLSEAHREAALRRPAFDPNRATERDEPAASTPQSPPASAQARVDHEAPRLLAVFEGPEREEALVAWRGEDVWVQPGDEVSGWRVERIGSGSVLLAQGDERRNLTMLPWRDPE